MATGNLAVTPTVTINTPTTTTLTAGAVDSSGNAKQYTFTASGMPGGGTYSWSVTSGSGITLTNIDQATLSVVGTASGTPTVTVTYAQNGQSATAQQNITVLKVDSIYVNNDTVQTKDCGGGLSCIRRVIEYTIKSGASTITDAINQRETCQQQSIAVAMLL